MTFGMITSAGRCALLYSINKQNDLGVWTYLRGLYTLILCTLGVADIKKTQNYAFLRIAFNDFD